MSGGDKSGRLLAGTGKTTPLREPKAACEQMGHALRIIEERKSALLVAPTWVEIEAVASHVRAELKARERLGKEEYEFRVFDVASLIAFLIEPLAVDEDFFGRRIQSLRSNVGR